MTRLCLTTVLLMNSLALLLQAAPSGSFSGSFPAYTFTAECNTPPGASVLFGGPCTLVDIDYNAVGTSSLFPNAELELFTVLVPILPGPFPFTGTFTLTDTDNPANTIFGSLAGAGNAVGPPQQPLGFPPFAIAATFTTTGGTGAFTGAEGSSLLSGTARFTFLNPETTFTSGDGAIEITAVPEPGTTAMMLFAFMSVAVLRVKAGTRPPA